MFFLTTFLTSSNAWDSSGALKHVRWERSERHLANLVSFILQHRDVVGHRPTYLEEIELVVVEDAIVVQVRHFEDASQGFHTKWLHLGIKKRKTIFPLNKLFCDSPANFL